jgi:putative ABC transport system substrate-binding protein
MMKRRDFITLLSAAAAWPAASDAQQPGGRARRIGALFGFGESDPLASSRVVAFQQGLERLGWGIGRNLVIDYRFGIYSNELARTAVAELLRQPPDLIVVMGTTALRAAQQATATVPIIFTVVYEPVAQGFAQSLAHPGGNITGFSNVEPTIGGKWVGLLKQVAPGVTRIAFIFDPEASPYSATIYQSIAAAAAQLKVEAVMVAVHQISEIEAAIAMLAREPAGGLIAGSDSFTIDHAGLIVYLTARQRVPAVYGHQQYIAGGGLVVYGADLENQYQLAAGYVDRIFRGERPAELPIIQPTKFDLAINLKTAKAIGLTIPPSLLAIADEVIE